MIQTFKNIPLKFKLILTFLFIILMNATSGLINLNVMRDLGSLVNMTYDKALMSSNFSQASKFDFSQLDLEFRAAMLSQTIDELDMHLEKMNQAQETLKEDLQVVVDRALSTKSAALITEIKDKLASIEALSVRLIELKKNQLSKKNSNENSVALIREWERDPNKKVLFRRLTALNDDAAVVGYQFRLDSEAKNNKNLDRTILILSLALILSFILSVFVSYLIIRPLETLKKVCTKVSSGDLTVRAEDSSKDEFGTLSQSFNYMLNTIHDKSENISSLLASLPFGLFYIDKEGKISIDRSQSTDKIFKNFTSYNHISEFFADHNCKTAKVDDILKAIFQNLIPFNSAVDLLPSSLEVGEGEDKRCIHLSYKPKFYTKKKVEKVIILAEDITDKIRAQEKSKELAERVERVSKVSSDINGFKEFLPAVNVLYKSIEENLLHFKSTKIMDIKRDLHSLKGLLGIYSFTTCASGIHAIESYLEIDFESKVLSGLEKVKKSHELFNNHSEDIVALLKLNNETGLKYCNENKVKIIQELAEKSGMPALQTAVMDLDKFPLDKVFAKYSAYAQAIANKLEDKKVKLVFESSSEISYEEVQKLDSVFIHVLNNSIDHGIENSSERAELKKSDFGLIKISFKRNPDHSMEFKISDDGKGINSQYLLEKAVRMGLVTEVKSREITEEEKLNLIFAPGLTSKETTSEISGRGVGMDAVKSYLESLGGTINLISTIGKGTTFSFTVPG